MLTIFHIIALVAAIAMLSLGYKAGEFYFGTAGGIAGAVVGGLVGLVIGRLPGILATKWLLGSLERKSSEELRKMIRNDRFYVYHLVFAQLMARGEDIQPERDRVLELLSSGERDRRVSGWHTLRFAFPEIADQIQDFEPGAPVEECRAKVRQLKLG